MGQVKLSLHQKHHWSHRAKENVNRPWRRIFSRLLDYFILFTIFMPVLDRLPVHQLRMRALIDLLVLFIWIFAESMLLTLTGTTPGKWLLHTYIRDKEGRKLTYMHALRRSYSVWRSVGHYGNIRKQIKRG